jgi:23S rRNA (guanine2445-N2)-methyltransferase / 23S rRNA (guanine2069-N7)-methyltransferase
VEEGLTTLYNQMGKVFQNMQPVSVNILSANPDLLHRLRLQRTTKKTLKNGPIDCLFASFEVSARAEAKPQATSTTATAAPINDQEAQALINRLKKNDKHLSRWARKNNVTCYRLYDADLPEFAFALDKYTSALNPEIFWLHLQEYQAPKTVEEEKAQTRIELAQKVIRQVFSVDEQHLFSKLRQRQRGRQQYEKVDQQGELFQVREGNALLLVNLSDYLDTGLFLDHRITRQMIQDQVKDKQVLNLFCYTGAVSVQAALGGANQVTSADMSATYLNWARENFELNDLVDPDKYHFVQADCLDLLFHPDRYGIERRYDLIFLDPPSFSNSKRMQQTLDIQRDHAQMIRKAMRLLQKKGKLFFSTNKKGFKLDQGLMELYTIADITGKTVSEDFKRRPKIHQCWEFLQE